MAFAFVPENLMLQTIDPREFVFPTLEKTYTDRVGGTTGEEVELRFCTPEDLEKFYPLAESQA